MAMSSGGSGKTEVMAHPWQLEEDCLKNVQLPLEAQGRRASDRPNKSRTVIVNVSQLWNTLPQYAVSAPSSTGLESSLQ